MKTEDLTGIALDWAVATALGLTVKIPAFAEKPWLLITDCHGQDTHCPSYSTDWSQGGPIMDRKGISIWDFDEGLCAWSGFDFPRWRLSWDHDGSLPRGAGFAWGPTILSAAMRCFVHSRLGTEVDIPPKLI